MPNRYTQLAGPVPAILLAAACYSCGASAVDLSVQPQVRFGVRSTDNVRWNTINQEAALGFDNGGGAVLKAESTDWRSLITPSFNIRRFSIGENLDADEYGVRTQHQWKPFEKLQTELKIDYARDSTLSTELTDVGRRNDIANRDTFTIQPILTYVVDSETSVNTSFLYTEAAFDSGQESGLLDSNFKQFSIGGSHVWSQKLSSFITTFVSDFGVPQIGGKTRTYGAQTGITYQHAPDLAVDLAAGYVKSDIEFLSQVLGVVNDPLPRLVLLNVPGEASTNGPIANVSIRKYFETSLARFDYVRRVSPSSRGSQTLEDDINLLLEHKITRTWQIGFRGGYNLRSAESQDVGGGIGELNRNQALLSGFLSYQFSNEVQVRADYRFARQTLTNTAEVVNVNGLFFSLNYNGEPIFFD